jgi:hypothetical protein
MSWLIGQQMPSIALSSTIRTAKSEVEIPYSDAALSQDLVRVRVAWEHAQSSRSRDAIYRYLNAVYALVTWWAAEGQDVVRAQRAVRVSGLDVFAREDPFAAVIRCTADAAKADKRTRSKWSRVMRYAAEHKLISEPLDRFVKRKGGINKCVARFSRSLGRDAVKRSERRLTRG